MFKPTVKLKKVLSTYGSYTYILRDGIVVQETREIKIDRDSFGTIKVWHIVPMQIDWRIRDYSKQYNWTDAPKVNCLIIHSGSLIANGFDEIEIVFNSGSLGTTEKKLSIDAVYFSLSSHKWSDKSIRDDVTRDCIYGSNVTICPNPYLGWSTEGYKSIREAYNQYLGLSGNSVVLYGNLPSEENSLSENRLLTVDS